MQRKNLFAAIAAFIWLLSGLAFALPAATVQHKSAEIGLTKITVEGVTYDQVSLPNTIVTMEPGEPQLPVQLVYLVIPSDQKVAGINIVSAISEPVAGTFNIYPSQPAVPIGDEAPSFTAPDQKIYAASSPYPGKLVEITGDGYMGGYHIVSLLVYPIQYTPVDGKLAFYNTISFSLQTSSGADGSVSRKRITVKASKLYEKMAQKLVSNPQDVVLENSKFKIQKSKMSKSGLVVEPFKITALPSDQGSPVEYLIITSEALKPEFERLAEWKTKKGTTSAVKTVEWINQNYSGCDGAEKVRNFIKDAYAYWGTVWVMLAGDVNAVPYRLAGIDSLPCDQYYMGLEGNWNKNGNSVFGEALPNFNSFGIYFKNMQEGVVSVNSNIVKTYDGGKSWQYKYYLNDARLYEIKDITFIDQNNGWAVGNRGVVLHTIDGGENWIKLNEFGEAVPFIKVCFADANNGWILSYDWNPRLYRTIDGGQTWTYNTVLLNNIVNSVCFVDGSYGWAVGGGGKITHTSDGGQTWSSQTSNTTITLYDVSFIDNLEGWACGGYKTLLHTTDGGLNWVVAPYSPPSILHLYSIKFKTNLLGWAGGYPGLSYTTDGGQTWQLSNNSVGYWNIWKIMCINDNDIWASGGAGAILSSRDGGQNCESHFVNIVDSVDLYPDVFVSRASVDDINEARTWINKLIAYETAPPTNYQNKMLFIGANLHGGNEGVMLKDTIDVNYVQSFPQFTIDKLYATGPYLNRENVITELMQLTATGLSH